MNESDRITQTVNQITLADGKAYKIMPATLKQMKQLRPYLAKISKWDNALPLDDPNVFDTLVQVCKIILGRNYPNIKEEEIEEIIDVTNIKKILNIAQGNAK